MDDGTLTIRGNITWNLCKYCQSSTASCVILMCNVVFLNPTGVEDHYFSLHTNTFTTGDLCLTFTERTKGKYHYFSF